eukprot:COSAG01_NODE_74_length_28433_cov_41.582269_13_plen_85_part_00
MELTDTRKSQSAARPCWPRPANLRRESCDWAQPKISARSESSSVEIVKTWLGFPYICDFFQICPHPLHTYMPHKKFPRRPLDRF